MKKFICFMLLTTLLLSFCGCGEKTISSTVSSASNTPLPEGAGNYKVDDFKYQVQEDGTVFVKYVGKDSEVVFPDEINGYKVTGIQTMSCWRNETLQKVTIPSSVKTIDSRAFHECSNLTTVILNEGLATIKDGAFQDCPNLTNIILPSTLTNLDFRVFLNCTSLKKINIPKNITTWGEETFANCTSLKNIDIENGVGKIAYGAFCNTGITKLVLPKSVKTIEGSAFSSCAQLGSVTLNEGLETMDSHIFAECPKLTEIIIPSTVKTVTDFTFDYNENIKAIKFEGDAPENFVNEDWEVKVWPVDYTVYYHKGAKGFTSPTWNGYKTEIW